MSAHALLSASGAHRWMNCTPSARLESEFPETTSTYAEEGRTAHSIAELTVRAYIENLSKRTVNSRIKKLKTAEGFDSEMLGYAESYLDYIKKISLLYPAQPHIAAEKKLDFSHVVPEGFGTGDCIIIGGDTLHIIDYKYGKGVPVSAADNPQMKLYALGAIKLYELLYNIQRVVLVIFQPRIDNTSEWETTAAELNAWAENEVKPLAAKAFAGEGEYSPGEHCRFCRAKTQCRARMEFYVDLDDKYRGALPPLISNTEVGTLLRQTQFMQDWINGLQKYALDSLLKGEDIPGWKAVEGRSLRRFTDQEAAFKTVVDSGVDEAVLYERKPIPLTQVEKLLGKTEFNSLLAEYIDKPPGAPTLAPENDKREPITVKTSAAEDFKTESA